MSRYGSYTLVLVNTLPYGSNQKVVTCYIYIARSERTKNKEPNELRCLNVELVMTGLLTSLSPSSSK